MCPALRALDLKPYSDRPGQEIPDDQPAFELHQDSLGSNLLANVALGRG
jgi:hypothetical protein